MKLVFLSILHLFQNNLKAEYLIRKLTSSYSF